MCKLLIKLGDDESFEKIISLIFFAIKNKITLYNIFYDNYIKFKTL